jgi:phenylalanyl-tRNA synthetase beta chain
MKFLLSWLKDHLDTAASRLRIAEKLTAIGLEVEDLSNPAEALAPFVVAKVLTAEKHPQADKLQVLTVDAGTGETIQVVCGASNAHAGMLGVFGGPGTYIPGSDLMLKVAAIRGVESHGMMCSARELELGDDHSGIIELPDDAPVGVALPLMPGSTTRVRRERHANRQIAWASAASPRPFRAGWASSSRSPSPRSKAGFPARCRFASKTRTAARPSSTGDHRA